MKYGWTRASLPPTHKTPFKIQEIDRALKMHAVHGLKVLRIFAFSNGLNMSNIATYYAIQPVLGHYSEVPLQRLDYILATGARYGLRFIMVLGNYEPELGGIKWWTESVLGEGSDPQLFYTNSKVKAAYKAYLAMLIRRNNTINGRRYSDEPAILSWEPMNEPHTLDQFEVRRGQPAGRMVWRWLNEITAHIKRLDGNHLVGTGEEGYRTSGKVLLGAFVWGRLSVSSPFLHTPSTDVSAILSLDQWRGQGR